VPASGDSDAADVFDFVDEFLTDREKGRERPLAHYLARYPRCQDAVAREYLALKLPVAKAAEATAAPASDAPRIGPYRILSEIGRGGQGTVFLAEDSRIARKVALKVLASRFDLVSEDRRRRFRREAEVIARLEHPGICGIYEADIDGEAPYIAMRHIEGRSLAEILAQARTSRSAGSSTASETRTEAPPEGDDTTTWPPGSPLDIRRVLLLFERVARALHAAHEAGVVHRDVKPGNLMIARDGQPVLLDFGLARDEHSEQATLTQSGDVFGTPAYMSPEQLTGGGAPLDRRTDVYSLAISLFEALTLARPFEAPSRIELYRRIREEPVPDARKRNPDLPEDVQVVLETALERDPNRRYATALDLAEDLRRIREYEPIRARPAGPLLRFSRWTRRHPVIAVSTIGTILALSAGLALALHLIDKRDSALADAERSLGYALGRHLAERCVALVAEDPAVALAVGVEAADQEIRQGGSTRGANFLTRSALFQALEACWLERVLDGSPAQFATDAALSPDGHRLALATNSGFVRVFDVDTGVALLELGGHAGAVARVFFTPEGERIVMAAADGKVRVLDARKGVLQRELDSGDALNRADLAKDGARVVVVVRSGAGIVFDLRSGGRTNLRCGAEKLEWAAFLPRDGGRVLACSASGRVEEFDATTGLSRLALDSGSTPAMVCAFDPVADRVAIGCQDGSLHVVDLADGKPCRPPLVLGTRIGFLAFSPDGTHLFAATGQDQTGDALVLDVATGARQVLAGHAGRRVVHGAFSEDGSQLATASFDATARVWDPSSGRQIHMFTGRARPVSVLWAPDGGRLVTLHQDWLANVWFTRNRPDLFDLAGHTGPVVRARFSPCGDRILTASADGTARIWTIPASSSASLRHILRHEGPLTDASFSRDGSRALTMSADRTARVWDVEKGERIGPVLTHPDAVSSGSFDADGARVLTLCLDGKARLFGIQSTSEPIEISSPDGPLACAAFDPSGELVVTAGTSDELVVSDARSGRRLRELTFTHDTRSAAYRAGVSALAVSPEGSEVAAACNDETLRFWNSRTGKRTRRDEFVFPARSLAYSRDGEKLLVTGRFGGGAAKVFVLGEDRRPTQAESAHALRSILLGGDFSADGSLILTYSQDGTAHVWDALDGRPVAHRASRDAAILDARFDGGLANPRVVVARADGSVSVWPVDPLPAARARMPRSLTPLEKEREQRLARPLRYD